MDDRVHAVVVDARVKQATVSDVSNNRDQCDTGSAGLVNNEFMRLRLIVKHEMADGVVRRERPREDAHREPAATCDEHPHARSLESGVSHLAHTTPPRAALRLRLNGNIIFQTGKNERRSGCVGGSGGRYQDETCVTVDTYGRAVSGCANRGGGPRKGTSSGAATLTMTYEHSLDNQDLREFYLRAGFAGRVGWGERPAILVIDMAGAWVSPHEQIGTDLSEVSRHIVDLLAEGRRIGLPIIFTTMAWDPSLSEIGEVVRRKTPHSEKMLHGSERVALRPEMGRLPHEPLVVKPRASAFFGTYVDAMLISAKVDTVVVVGCSTSGCIRATAESAFNRGFHVIVPQEAVGDRSPSAHAANLFDIDARYGDVVPTADVLTHLRALPSRKG